MYEKIKYHVYDILVETDDGERIDRIVAIFLMLLILLNGIVVVLETVDSWQEAYGPIFHAFELVSIAVFTLEYLLRLWIAPLDPHYAHPVWGRIRYAFSAMALVDLVAILPAFLPMFFAIDLRFLRLLRILRLFRLFKLSRYIRSMDLLDDVIRAKREQLLVTVVMIAILLLFASSLMYVVENEAQPDKFTDIPSAMWWGVATITTVGYGDVFPITPLGKLLGAFVAFLGIGMFALPTSILASGFTEIIEGNKKTAAAECTCPHCGKDISEVIKE
jgi:voltage-gated potassium channel